MSEVKLKGHSKFKTYGRCDSVQKSETDNVDCTPPQKSAYKDYVNEIFAGLMWLG